MNVGLHLVQEGRWLVASFASRQSIVSWAAVNGGLREASVVAWYEVRERELVPPADAKALLRTRLAETGIPDAVGLMTGLRLTRYVDVTRRHGEHAARCVATVGLGNALRAGDPPGPAPPVGTINVLCAVTACLSSEALLEAMGCVAEARAAALLEGGVKSRSTDLPATGTGTDCIVVAAPASGTPEDYAGKHTVVGHLVGAATLAAIAEGVAGALRTRAEAW